MGALNPPPFSPVVLLTLLAVVGASSVTFWLLVRRATSHRQWVALSDWARDTGFRFIRNDPRQLPPPLDAIRGSAPTIRLSLGKRPVKLVQVELPPPQAAATPANPPRVLWNLLLREMATDWPPTGLRPGSATASALDMFSLSSFPTLGATERFVAFGTDSAAARALSKSMLRALLPADIGLLLIGRHLLLDFSDRPFDAIEFGRMLALAEQLAGRIPAPAAEPRT